MSRNDQSHSIFGKRWDWNQQPVNKAMTGLTRPQLRIDRPKSATWRHSELRQWTNNNQHNACTDHWWWLFRFCNTFFNALYNKAILGHGIVRPAMALFVDCQFQSPLFKDGMRLLIAWHVDRVTCDYGVMGFLPDPRFQIPDSKSQIPDSKSRIPDPKL